MGLTDFANAVPVARDIIWVGRHDPDTDFHCNAYLLVDEKDTLLIDPGSIPDFHVVMRKIIDVIDPQDVTCIVASHQDPDVCGNLAVVEEIISRPDLRIAATSETVRLIKSLGLRSSFFDVNANGRRLVLKSGRVLEFIPTPYLHSPGAMITLDSKTHTAFTSDLFGGLSAAWTLFAEAGYLEAMAAFHQRYMPSNAILRACMQKLESYDVQRICPQHGSVIEGPQVAEARAFLRELPCGIDLREDYRV